MEYTVSFWDSHLNIKTHTYDVQTLSFSDIAERFRHPIVTSESAEDYALWGRLQKKAVRTRDRIKQTHADFRSMPQFKKAIEQIEKNGERRSKAKNVGCFFAGVYDPQQNRGNSAVQFRSMLSFDLDKNMDRNAFEKLIDCLDETGSDYLIHTTHSHLPDRGRFRIYVPMAQKITDQAIFEAVGKAFSESFLPVDWLDDTTYQWARLMYVPSVPTDGQYLFRAETGRGPFDVKRLQLDPNEIRKRQQAIKNQDRLKGEAPANDPRNNPVPIIRYFCRAFFISQAIERFLPDIYEPTRDATRYSFIGGSGAAGFKIFPGDLFAYSHDESDPAGWDEARQIKHAINAYDLVRIHLFNGDTHAMNAWAYHLPEVQDQQAAEIREDFDVLDDFGMPEDAPDPQQETRSASDPYFEETTEGVANINLYGSKSVAERFPDFEKEINTAFKPIPTGFEALDDLLAGGLYAGTYFIGAISSLGKTTISLQIADQIAATGQDVLFFSLEMSPTELMAKSISRISAQLVSHEQDDFRVFGDDALDGSLQVHEILRGPQELSDPVRMDLFERAKTVYREQTGSHLFIVKESAPIDAKHVHAYVSQHVRLHGTRPVVVLDYLQVLKPQSERQNEKQAADANVLKLKEISVQHNIPIIAISSFNRQNYYTPVSPESFKESGNIEYGADVLLGLQYQGMEYQKVADNKGKFKWEDEKTRSLRVRQMIAEYKERGYEGKAQPIQVKVMKNRRYRTGSVDLFLYPKYNLVSPIDFDEFSEDPDNWTD